MSEHVTHAPSQEPSFELEAVHLAGIDARSLDLLQAAEEYRHADLGSSQRTQAAAEFIRAAMKMDIQLVLIESPPEDIGRVFRNRRDSLGLRLREVAEVLDISEAYMSRMERGERVANVMLYKMWDLMTSGRLEDLAAERTRK